MVTYNNTNPELLADDAKFNMALATLKRVDDLLLDYRKVSTMMSVDANNQMIKYKFVRQIYLACVPLFKTETREKIKTKVDSIEIRSRKSKEKTVLLYSQEVDFELDNVVEAMLVALQDEGSHFMPKKGDQGLF